MITLGGFFPLIFVCVCEYIYIMCLSTHIKDINLNIFIYNTYKAEERDGDTIPPGSFLSLSIISYLLNHNSI